MVETDGLAGQRDRSVPFHPEALRLGQNLVKGMTYDVGGLEARLSLESRVHLQEPVVAGPTPVITDDLVEGESFIHGLEEIPVAFLALPECLLCAPLCGHIVEDKDHTGDVAFVVLDRRCAVLDGDRSAPPG